MLCDFRWQELGPRLAQCPFLPSMATITRWPTTQKSTSKGSQRKSEFIYISSFSPSVMLDLHYLRGSNLHYLDLVNCKCKWNSGLYELISYLFAPIRGILMKTSSLAIKSTLYAIWHWQEGWVNWRNPRSHSYFEAKSIFWFELQG